MIPFTSCMCPARKPFRRRGCWLVAPQDGTAIEVEESDEPGFCFYPKGSLDLKRAPVSGLGEPWYISRRRRRCPVITPVNDLNFLDDTYSGIAQVLLSKSNRWSFNTFNLDVSTGGRSLPFLLVHLFHEYDFINYFQLDVIKVWRCFNLMEAVYHRHNPYHNSVHAADVTQAMHCFLQENKFASNLTPLEAMASIIAAVAHDLDHPGVTQTFLVATSNHLVNLYHSSSVLENHHWRTAVSCILESEIFSHLDKDIWKDVQETIKSLILATDITRQKEFLLRFKGYLNAQELDMTDSHYRHFALQIALKCADLCNPCRPWGISQRWSYQVCQEFYRQGSFERQLNLPLTPTFDCSKTRVPKIQTDFFQHVVIPLFDTWNSFLETRLSNELLRNLQHNYGEWQRKMELTERQRRPENLSEEDYLPFIRLDFDEKEELDDMYLNMRSTQRLSHPPSSEIRLEAYSTEELHPLTTLLSLTSTKSMISLRKACIIGEVEHHLMCPLAMQPLSSSSSSVSLSDCQLSCTNVVDQDKSKSSLPTPEDNDKSSCSISQNPLNCKGGSSSDPSVIQGCCSPVSPTKEIKSSVGCGSLQCKSSSFHTEESPKTPDCEVQDAEIPSKSGATPSDDDQMNKLPSHSEFPKTFFPSSIPLKTNSTKTSLCSTKNVQKFIAPVKLTASWCWHIKRSLSAERSHLPAHDMDHLLSSQKGSQSCQTCNRISGRRGSAPAPIAWGRDNNNSQTSSLGNSDDKIRQMCGPTVRRWSIPLEPISG